VACEMMGLYASSCMRRRKGRNLLHGLLSRVIKAASTDVGEMYHAPILHVVWCVCVCVYVWAGSERRACLPLCTQLLCLINGRP
jgi:hypothetical protein